MRLGASVSCMCLALSTIATLFALPALGFLSSGSIPTGDRHVSGSLPAPTAPTVVGVSSRSADLEWAQPPPAGFTVLAYEVQAADAFGQVVWYKGASTTSTFSPLLPGSHLCARVRLRLQPGEVLSPWSSCAWVVTSPPTPPAQTPTPWATGSSTAAVRVEWAPPDDGGLPIDAFALRLSTLQEGLVERCEWTGATCNAGCADLPGERNWTLAESEWQGVFAKCAGANELGCCGLQCWCHSHRCCEQMPGLVRANTHETFVSALARNATISAPALGPGAPFALELRAHNARGWAGAWSPSLALHADLPDAAQPAPPELELSAVRSRSLGVRWRAPDERGAIILGYELSWALEGGPQQAAQPGQAEGGQQSGSNGTAAPNSTVAALPPAGAYGAVRLLSGADSFSLGGLQPLSTYALRLRAFNSRGPSQPSRPLLATTREPEPPEPPSAVHAADALSDGLVVAWQPPAPPPPSPRGASFGTQPAAGPAGEGGGQAEGEVAAEAGVVLLEFEAQAAALPTADAADAAQLGNGTASPAAPAGAPFPLVAGQCAVAAPALSCTIAGLAPSTTYALRARARSADGWGSWSAPAAAPLARTTAEHGCLRLADRTALLTRRAALHATLDRCSKDCWAAAECVSRCVARSGVSAACADCFGEVSACGKKHCLDKCVLDPDGQPCRECSRAMCMGEYTECVGLPEALVP